MKKSLLYLLVFFLLSGCEEEVPLDTLEPYTEKLVVNEFFNNQDVFSIQISVSKNAYKTPEPVVLDSSKLKISLLENNTSIPLLYNAFDKVFYTNTKPSAGKLYTLSVSSSGYPSVKANGSMPGLLTGKKVEYVEDGGIDMQGNTSDLLKITFKDDPNTKDYYKLNFFYYSELVDKLNAFDFELKDILSAVNTIKTRDGGFLFSDESFNGQSKTLTAVPPFGLVKANTTFKYLIRIERLSEDYWKYNTTLEQYRGGLDGGVNGTNLFGGAVVVYTNVKNGLGIFAGANIENDTIR
ncbi:MAG: DUF4249 domain-containing protein [Flavobacteriales bacterium]|nr:DUF4249 domain-containing protein [Flavobacteriales bacterium]